MEEIFKMNDWTWPGLIAGLGLGFWIGMFVHNLIVTYFRKKQ